MQIIHRKSYHLFFIFIIVLFSFQPAFTSRHLVRMVAEEAEPSLRLVTFDGGGMRGVISLEIAKEIKKRLGWETLSDGVEWFAGSSTGSILATGYANNISSEHLKSIYVEEGPKIFQKSWWGRACAFRGELYDDTAFVRALKEHFTDKTFAHLKRDIVVLSNDIEGSKDREPGPVIFNSARPEQQEIPLWTVPRASSSAPTYFKPFFGFKDQSLIDGGTIANMPTQTAISQIISLYGDDHYKAVRDNLKIISIGTGTYHTTLTRQQSKSMGYLDWAPRITTMMIQDRAKLQVQNLQQLHRQNFVRLNPVLDAPVSLDVTTPEAFEEMEKIAQDYINSDFGNAQIERAVLLLKAEEL
tara:strand:- start:1156 stop:2223 length:1068 start_codon:yes stop_codon:yes gene_type:complete